MKKLLNNIFESFKHNWYLYLLGISHLAFWLFIFITMGEILAGKYDLTGIVDVNEVMFSYEGHEYTLFDMWFFMIISAFMVLLINTISLVNSSILKAIAKLVHLSMLI